MRSLMSVIVVAVFSAALLASNPAQATGQLGNSAMNRWLVNVQQSSLLNQWLLNNNVIASLRPPLPSPH